MSSFESQLQATRANLERLDRLAAECKDLFEHANLIQVNDEGARVYIHASKSPDLDWRALAQKYGQAHWKREQSASYFDKYDWTGAIDGIEVSILGVEPKPVAQPLFSEVPV
ncbi:MAG: hypothetical protein V4563_14915 [Pseudomonadota bacterium]